LGQLNNHIANASALKGFDAKQVVDLLHKTTTKVGSISFKVVEMRQTDGTNDWFLSGSPSRTLVQSF
jgi:hypothetical protein